MKLAGVAVSDIGECGGTDKDQDGGKGKNTFHRCDSFRLSVGNFVLN